MVSFVIQPPEAFCFTTPAAWPKWRKWFEHFYTASGLCDKSGSHQVNTLLYLMSDQAEDILGTFKLSGENSQNIQVVLKQFDSYFIPWRNVIFEWARFNTRVQNDGESVEDFVIALHKLSNHCEYGTLREELVRDRLVVSIQDQKLSARLQLDADLTLHKALEFIKKVKSVRQQQAELHPDTLTVNKLASGRQQVGHSTNTTNVNDGREHFESRPHPRPADNVPTLCLQCGKERHPHSLCPARTQVCKGCHKKGHYTSVCMSHRVDIVEASGPDSEGGFVGTVLSFNTLT
ncbi:uncharacterized protein LOC144115033 [Amblyomma americanum]